jgi:hypothetical protein
LAHWLKLRRVVLARSGLAFAVLLVAVLGGIARGDQREANSLLATAYDRKARGDEEGALEAFDEARKAGAPAQRISLELAYMYLGRGDNTSARLELQAAAKGPDQALAAQARKQLAMLPRPWWADVYVESFGWHRARGANDHTDMVPTARMRILHRFSERLDFHGYAFAQATRDTASRGLDAAVPAIYADNSAMVGAGVLLRLAKRSIGLFAQVGPAFPIIDDGRDPVLFDARGGGFVSLASSACFEQYGTIENETWCIELYSEAVYTNRFDNDVQGFARQRTSVTYANTGPVSWQLFMELRAALDRNGDYFDNFVDAGLGPRWRLRRPLPIDLQVGMHAGSYLGRENVDPLPMQHDYVDVRALVTTYVEME